MFTILPFTCLLGEGLAVTLAMHQYDISLENKLLLQLYFYTFYNDLWKLYLTNRQVRLTIKIIAKYLENNQMRRIRGLFLKIRLIIGLANYTLRLLKTFSTLPKLMWTKDVPCHLVIKIISKSVLKGI